MSADPSSTRCVRVIYSGRVQGVGFRWTTSRIASRHEVSGSVRNVADGTVELMAQGQRSVVTAFLAEVSAAMQNNIERVDTEEMDVRDDLAGFRVRR